MSYGVLRHTKSIGEVPRYISANTAAALERKMLRVQLNFRGTFKWQFIQYNPDDKKWYAWFLIDYEQAEGVRQKLKAEGVKDE